MKGIEPAKPLISLYENFPPKSNDDLWQGSFCGEGACPRSTAQQS
ncbi:hypothetical protein J2X87_003347 [Pseudomonas synxantha]|jgi:hypothetical protein|uniref:Uncharacterized protein n=1 Tax=Pseudomonas synxantha TaxID=47883 RepID=A0ACC6JNZ8_9PSED|nr:hypothetical protein [Pseudomonas synxantha]